MVVWRGSERVTGASAWRWFGQIGSAACGDGDTVIVSQDHVVEESDRGLDTWSSPMAIPSEWTSQVVTTETSRINSSATISWLSLVAYKNPM